MTRVNTSLRSALLNQLPNIPMCDFRETCTASDQQGWTPRLFHPVLKECGKIELAESTETVTFCTRQAQRNDAALPFCL